MFQTSWHLLLRVWWNDLPISEAKFYPLIKKYCELNFWCKVRYQDKIWAPKHEKYNWEILGDLKAIVLLLGLQLGCTKFWSFLREWDSRYRKHYYIQKQWPKREPFIPGQKNVTNTPLINPEKVYLPLLHIRLGIKKFRQGVDQNSAGFMDFEK